MPLTRPRPLTVRSLLVWGLLAGLVGGILAFAFATAFGEPPVEQAIALEEPTPHTHGEPNSNGQTHSHGEEPVSRPFQATAGLAIGTIAFGLALGGLFAITYAFTHGRLGTLTPRATALSLAALGFLTVTLVPFLTYPPNPPAVGQGSTIEERTTLYFTMIAISTIAAILATTFAAKRNSWPTTLLAATTYAALITTIAKLLPTYNEIPPTFPADLLWDFRIASLGTSTVLWSAIAVTFATLLHRATATATATHTP
ncbi:CbtA family protein [Actinokineospora sp. NPDC004072]